MGDFTTAGEVESVTAHEVINKSLFMFKNLDDEKAFLWSCSALSVRLLHNVGGVLPVKWCTPPMSLCIVKSPPF